MFNLNHHFLRPMVLFFALLVSPVANADFDYSGHGQLVDANGNSHSFQFGFSFLKHEGQYKFNAGRLSMAVDEVPKRYTLELVLHDQQQIWVAEFSKQPIQGFDWQIGDHRLQLNQEPATPKRPARFKLTVDNTDYFFTSKNRGQIQLKFNEKGITEIEVDSMMTQKR